MKQLLLFMMILFALYAIVSAQGSHQVGASGSDIATNASGKLNSIISQSCIGRSADLTSGFLALYSEPLFLAGDANGDRIVNISDAVFLVIYIFKGGAAPQPLQSGDADCNGFVNVADAVLLVNHIFNAGPAPQQCF